MHFQILLQCCDAVLYMGMKLDLDFFVVCLVDGSKVEDLLSL